MGLRERKKEETRRGLMRHALRLFAERGYDATTVEEIAAAADVSPRTFFRYYPRKVDVLFGDVDERRSEIAAALASETGAPPLERIRGAVLAMAGAFAEEPELYAARARLVFSHDELHAEAYLRMSRVEALLRVAFASELGTDPERDVRPRLAAAAVTAAIRSTAMTWAQREGRGDPRQLVRESFDLIERGLGTILARAAG